MTKSSLVIKKRSASRSHDKTRAPAALSLKTSRPWRGGADRGGHCFKIVTPVAIQALGAAILHPSGNERRKQGV
jgi:hypothetical protein